MAKKTSKKPRPMPKPDRARRHDFPHIDDMDAKMNQVTTLIEKDPGNANWTAWQNALQTKLYRKKIE